MKNGNILSALLGVISRIDSFKLSPCRELQVLLKVPGKVVRKGEKKKKGQEVVGEGTIPGGTRYLSVLGHFGRESQ